MDTTVRDQLAEQLVQVGRDEMARVLADELARHRAPGLTPDAYVDGIDDALCMLIQAGAADPR